MRDVSLGGEAVVGRGLSSRVLQAVGCAGARLERLVLATPHAPSLDALGQCTQLREVCLSRLEELEPGALERVVGHWRELRSLRVEFSPPTMGHASGVSGVGAVALASRMPQLVALSLSACASLEDVHVSQLVRCLPHLTALDISACPRVTDASLLDLRTWGSRLRSVRVTETPRVTKAALDALRSARGAVCVVSG
jgi:hypothetical protein